MTAEREVHRRRRCRHRTGDDQASLEMLVFLLPFVVVYEIGIALFFSSDAGGTGILAYVLLEQLFVSLGLGGAGMALPGVLVVVALLVQHVLSRASWTLHPPTLVAMAVESLVLTLPLLIFARRS